MSFRETRGALRVLAGKSAGQSLGKIETESNRAQLRVDLDAAGRRLSSGVVIASSVPNRMNNSGCKYGA
jgi:hypothetical protein